MNNDEAIAWWAEFFIDEIKEIVNGAIKDEPGSLSVSEISKLAEIPSDTLVRYLDEVRLKSMCKKLNRHQVILALANYLSPQIAQGKIAAAEGVRRLTSLCELDDLEGQLVPFRVLYERWCAYPEERGEVNLQVVALARQHLSFR